MAQATLPHDVSRTHAAGLNIIPLRQSVLPRHREYLSRWLEAGTRMGLFDAEIVETDKSVDHSKAIDYVLVWVRENPDPAYLLRPQGMRWILVDQLRDNELGSYASFEHALHTIRPVLPISNTYAA
ncbi:hypothetical protein [Swingsia samuiensis]|uniref:Uncharacterized protein n=1 Tax=Swingsia samuiensis TaxID=1293412 RepID=A0A4Y6UMN5_9PROT|nr:hypothetical protein [Swingsia samuiensis]QDH17651.1 hypothetical protein E3D00_08825 [Swingsia samuiensis]